MKSSLLLTAAAVAAATLTAVAPALAAPHAKAAQVRSLRSAISWHRQMTWRYQDRAGVAHTRTVYAERRIRSVPFLRWEAKLWLRRQHKAKRLIRRISWTGDWQTAVAIVQRTWPGSKAWLLACSSSEGGWGGFVYNTQGSGAGGWMQYMSGTFSHDLHGALAEAWSRHLPTPPRAARSWHSALGQAFAAGWAYFYDRPAGKWTGARC